MPAMSCPLEDTASLRYQMATDSVVVDASVSASDYVSAAAAVDADAFVCVICSPLMSNGFGPAAAQQQQEQQQQQHQQHKRVASSSFCYALGLRLRCVSHGSRRILRADAASARYFATSRWPTVGLAASPRSAWQSVVVDTTVYKTY
jgi:hypothetical protein